MTPVSPPSTKLTMNPKTKSRGVANRKGRPHKVAIQQKICTPEGMAITMLEAVKKLSPRRGRPVVNM